jgi:DNA primase
VAPGGDESQAKYVNTPETEVYHKSKILYGIDKAKSKIRQEDYVLLVEGNMDVIASHQAGVENVVAVSGTALTSTQLDILKRYTKNLKMLFDMDEAGEAATKKSAKLCFEKDFSLQIVELPFGKDAADVARSNPEKLRAAVGGAQNAMEYFFRKTFASFDREKADGKKQISNLLLEMIGHLSNNVERSHWMKKLASELDVSDTALTEEYKKVKIGSSGRIEQKKDGALPKETLQPEKGKLELLLEEILGFSLVSGDVWKEIEKKVEYHPFFQQDKLLGFMLKNGGNLEYDFGRLLESVDAGLKSRAESIFFQKKFRQGLDNGPEEIPPEYFQKDIDILFAELGKEIKKLKLESIARDLRIAEGRKDEGAIKFLRQEFENILSRDI